jgi:hypothetical protein
MIYPELSAWLESDDSIPCVLFEVQGHYQGSEQVFYFSTLPYVTGSSESPQNTAYLPLATGGGLSESVSLAGGASVSFGTLELENTDGSLDHLPSVVWSNRRFSAYLGDPSWPRSQFKLVQAGYVDSMDAKNRDYLTLRLRDNLQALNYPLSEGKLDNTDETFIPLSFGDLSNVTPILSNPQTLTYKVHTGPVADIEEVRDNGVPVEFTKDLSNGEFTLSNSPIGNITASVRGDNASGYTDTVAGLILRMVSGFSPDHTLPSAEIDSANFSGFETSHPQCVGVYYDSRVNIISAVNYLAKSLGASTYMSRTGKLRILRLSPAGGSPIASISPANISQGSFSIKELPQVEPAVRLAYNRNYTVQESLITGIPERHKQQWQENWKYRTAKNESAVSLHKLFDEPEAEETALQVGSEAQQVAQWRVDLMGTQRTVYGCRVVGSAALLEVGDVVMLSYSRYGLDNGVLARVTSCRPNWSEKTADLELLV